MLLAALSEQLRRCGGGRLGVVLGLTAIWWACAVGVTVVLKAALGGAGSGHAGHSMWRFPYPLTLTLFANIGTAAATGLLAAAVSGGRACAATLETPRSEAAATPRAQVLRVTSREALLCDGDSSPRLRSERTGAYSSDGSPELQRDSPCGDEDGATARLRGASFFNSCCGNRRPRSLWARGASPLSPTASMRTPPTGSTQVPTDLRVLEEPDPGERTTCMERALSSVTVFCHSCGQRWACCLDGGRGSIVVIGLLQGLALGVKNEALLLLSVSTRTMIFATNVLAVMLIARLCGLESLKRIKLVSAILLAGGGMMQGIATWQRMGSGPSDDPLGYALAILALLLDALRWVLLQAVFTTQDSLSTDPAASGGLHEPGHTPPYHHRRPSHNEGCEPVSGGSGAVASASPTSSSAARRPSAYSPPLSKFGMVSLVMWMTTPVCLVLSVIFEPAGLVQAARKPMALAGLVSMLTLGVMGINMAEFGVVQWTSAVTFNVLSQLHSIPMVLAGVVCFGEEVGTVQVAGFAVCLLGAVLYSWARAREKHMVEPLDEQGEEGDPDSSRFRSGASSVEMPSPDHHHHSVVPSGDGGCGGAGGGAGGGVPG